MKRMFLLSIVVFVILISVSADATLLARYEFNGNANDSVGGHHGSFVGDATTIYDAEMGQVLSTLNSGYVSIPDSTDFRFQGSFSLAAWFKTTDAIKGAIMRFNSFGGTSIRIYVNWSNIGELYTYVEPEIIGYNSNPFNDGQWHHVAITIDGDDMTGNYDLYVDGIWAGKETVEAYYTFHWAWITIGAAGGDDQFIGCIDDVRIYDHALSESEILALVPEPCIFFLLALGGLLIRKR